MPSWITNLASLSTLCVRLFAMFAYLRARVSPTTCDQQPSRQPIHRAYPRFVIAASAFQLVRFVVERVCPPCVLAIVTVPRLLCGPYRFLNLNVLTVDVPAALAAKCASITCRFDDTQSAVTVGDLSALKALDTALGCVPCCLVSTRLLIHYVPTPQRTAMEFYGIRGFV